MRRFSSSYDARYAREGKCIVEHFRDLANFLAFGPGYVHFVSRDEWLRLAAHANLAVASETKITPWVTALTLARVS